jgi:hypothetical protein
VNVGLITEDELIAAGKKSNAGRTSKKHPYQVHIRKPPIRTFYHVHYRGLSSKCEGSGFFYCKYINNKEKLRIEANLKETGELIAPLKIYMVIIVAIRKV